MYLNWFSPQDKEMLSSHHHESHELLTQNLLNLISLEERKREREGKKDERTIMSKVIRRLFIIDMYISNVVLSTIPLQLMTQYNFITTSLKLM